jgi:hypothetical protein
MLSAFTTLTSFGYLDGDARPYGRRIDSFCIRLSSAFSLAKR